MTPEDRKKYANVMRNQAETLNRIADMLDGNDKIPDIACAYGSVFFMMKMISLKVNDACDAWYEKQKEINKKDA